MQATRVMLVLMVVVTQFRDSLVVAQKHNLDQSRCPTAPCKNEATPVDVALSIIGYAVSSSVMLYAWVRVNKRIDGQENLVKDRWFMAFLGIMTIMYGAWVAYSFEKCYCDATIYMIVSSIFGAVALGLYFLMGLVREIGQVDDKWLLACLVIATGTAFAFADNINVYTAMTGTFVAHVCRVLGTDYARFSGAQCFVSLVGCAGGFLSIRHPHLIKEQPFRITLIVLACIRGLEFLWWILLFFLSLPRVRHWLQGKKLDQWCAYVMPGVQE